MKSVLYKNIRYVDLETELIHDNIWPYLKDINKILINPKAFENNILSFDLNRIDPIPIINNFLPLYIGDEWDVSQKKIKNQGITPFRFNCSFDKFIEISSDFFLKYKDQHIGVQLSGGFDSSLIIALLKFLKIPFSLVGVAIDRYEFRTERIIQNLMSQTCNNIQLINSNDILPFSYMNYAPVHQYPDISCINYRWDNAMAITARKLNIDILLTGNGGDNLFCDPIQMEPALCKWMPKLFGDPWAREYIYQSAGIQLVDFYSDDDIVNAIYNLRYGEGLDPNKLWARNYFKDLLPFELSNFFYRADYWGVYIEGLIRAYDTLIKMFKDVFEMTKNPFFSQDAIEKILDQDLLMHNKEMYQMIESRIAIASWAFALNKYNCDEYSSIARRI